MFISRGSRRFDRCEHKDAHFVGGSNPTEVVLDCPYTQENDRTVSISSRSYSSAKLFNAKVNYHQEFKDQEIAYNELARIAGEIACDSCPYFKMDKQELSEARLESAQTELATAQAEKARLEAILDLADVEASIESLRGKIQSD